MPASERIPEEYVEKVSSAAKIPRDSSLDLLHADASINAGLLRNINIVLELIYSEISRSYIEKLGTGKKLTDLISKNKGDVSVYVEIKDFFTFEKVTLFARPHRMKITSDVYKYLKNAEEQDILKYKIEMT